MQKIKYNFKENFLYNFKTKQNQLCIALVFYIGLIFYYLISYKLPFDSYIGFFLFLTLLLFVVKLKGILRPIFIVIYVGAIYSAMHNISGKGIILYQYVIKIEKFLFGEVLPHFFQKNIGGSGITFLDISCVTIYLLHFIFPIILGLFFWIKDKENYEQFVSDLLIVSLIGFGIYLLIPTAPPWLASQKGLIPVVDKYMFKLADALPSLNFKNIYLENIGNMYGAMPSIHAAYPSLIYLYLGKYNKKNFIVFLPVLLFIYFTLIYLGEHYGIDVIGGISLTLLIFFLKVKR